MLDKKKFYINGKWIAPSKSNDFEVINPSNEEPFAIISLGDIEDTNLAIKSAKDAFKTWSKTSKEARLKLIDAARIVMARCLILMDMDAPEKM